MYSHEPSKRANEDATTEPRGVPGKSTLTGGMSGGVAGAGGAPILPFAPGGNQVPSGDVSFLDSLIGPGVSAKAADKGFPDVPDGEWVPWKGPYTENDRPKLMQWLMDRFEANRAVRATFLGDFVDAAITIIAKYAIESVLPQGRSEFEKFAEFAVTQALGTVVDVAVTAAAGPVLGVLAGAGVEWVLGRLMEESTSQNVDDMKTMIARLAASSGSFVTDAVNEIGTPESELAVWLSKAEPDEFHQFRIPRLLHAPDRQLVRGAMAGTVAGAHHLNLLHGGRQPTEWAVADRVTEIDNHVLLIDMLARDGEAHVDKCRFRTNSEVLGDEIINQVGLASLEQVPMHVTITGDGDEKATTRLLTKLRAPFPVEADDHWRFTLAYPNGTGPLVFTRMPDGTIDVDGGTLAEQLVLYQWAENDHDLSELVAAINATEEDEESQTSKVGYHSAEFLARRVRERVRKARLPGARKLATSRMFAVQVPTKA